MTSRPIDSSSLCVVSVSAVGFGVVIPWVVKRLRICIFAQRIHVSICCILYRVTTTFNELPNFCVDSQFLPWVHFPEVGDFCLLFTSLCVKNFSGGIGFRDTEGWPARLCLCMGFLWTFWGFTVRAVCMDCSLSIRCGACLVHLFAV